MKIDLDTPPQDVFDAVNPIPLDTLEEWGVNCGVAPEELSEDALMQGRHNDQDSGVMMMPSSCLAAGRLSAYLAFYLFARRYLNFATMMVGMYVSTCWLWLLICGHRCMPFYEGHFELARFLRFPNESCLEHIMLEC